jgi:hypothetical protein
MREEAHRGWWEIALIDEFTALVTAIEPRLQVAVA